MDKHQRVTFVPYEARSPVYYKGRSSATDYRKRHLWLSFFGVSYWHIIYI